MKSLHKYNFYKDWAVYENMNETVPNCNVYMNKFEKKRNEE